MGDCIFCKIVRKEIPKELRYEDEQVVAFDDINPLAPIHLIIIPRKHIDDFYNVDEKTLISIHSAIKKIVDKLNLEGKGYRITVNAGGAQIMPHLHFHLRAPMSPHTKL